MLDTTTLTDRAAAARASWNANPSATAKGIAVVAMYQIRRALIDMDLADRAEVRELLAELVAEQPIATWEG